MDYDKNTLLWIKEWAPHLQEDDSEWDLVYVAISEYNDHKDRVQPDQVYDFLVHNVGMPDVMAEAYKAMNSSNTYSSNNLKEWCDHWENHQNGGFSLSDMHDIRNFVKDTIKICPTIDKDGLLLWVWLWRLNNGDEYNGIPEASQAVLDTAEYIRSL